MADKINKPAKRQKWGTRFGTIMAVAGSAVGLGNFLRFPVLAAQHGGGAFMIPYFISLILLGIPLMWIEWTAGRYGGGYEHSTAPGIFHTLWEKNRFIKYFGVIGIFGPLVILIYYIYIESWTLAYSFFSLTGRYASCLDQKSMQNFLLGFQGLQKNEYFTNIWWAYLFFLITFALNMAIIYKGITMGIEKFCKYAMPVLFVFGILIVVRVLSLGAPDPQRPGWSSINGLGFFWNPDFSALKSAKVWLAAAGQIFFTLSVGIGVILTYASYLSKGDDVALSGLTAAATNEFAEVILGGSIVITSAFVFLGPLGTKEVAASGAFNLGFVTMPLVFQKLPLGGLIAACWFIMLFLAGITSSISLAQPAVAFMEDEFNIDRKRAVFYLGAISFILCQPVIFLLGRGIVNELDFWGGTFCLVLFATVETVVFGWIFGIDRAWVEMHRGADINIPRIYKFIIKYITPLFLFFILGFWLYQEGIPTILMKGVSESDRVYVLSTRLLLAIIFVSLAVMVRAAWARKRRQAR